jgi:hypothetical protein
VIAPVASLGALLRTTKIRSLLEKTGRPIVHLAWKRAPEDALNDGEVQTVVVLEGGGYKNAGLAKWYLRYIFAARKALAAYPAGTPVYALTFWSALGPWMLQWRKRYRLFFDNNDNIAMAYPWPRLVRPWVVLLEKRIAARSSIHLVPGASRWPTRDANLRIVPNVPSSDITAAAEQIVDERGYVRPEVFTLYVNGWLTAERGLTAMIHLLEDLPDVDFRVLVAGRVDGGEGGGLTTMPRVEYLGRVSPAESLALYTRSHAVLTFYDPALPINRVAEANKWGDCVWTGTSFIVNSEVMTAAPYLEAEACYAVPFSDRAALADLIRRLAVSPSDALERGVRLRAFAAEPWDTRMEGLIREWLA